jgi:hypothetical protein
MQRRDITGPHPVALPKGEATRDTHRIHERQAESDAAALAGGIGGGSFAAHSVYD